MGTSARPRPSIPFRFRWLSEDEPGPMWTALFERTWSSYRRWFLKDGDERRPRLRDCRRQLERYMPELVPVWERLVALAGGDEKAARMLSLYCPTPYMSGCSQAVWSHGDPILVRNYDYHPSACEGTFLRSNWTGTPTLVSSDCLWGVLDGMNAHGLVVSLAFGGRRIVGEGFGIPILLRFILETCRATAEGAAVLQRIPSHMPYNVSLLDASGDHAVVAVAPDRSTSVLRTGVATNHQKGGGRSSYDRATRTFERERYLRRLLAQPSLSARDFAHRFVRAPLHNTRYDRAFGTIYTAVYRPTSRTAQYLWPTELVEQSLDAFEPSELVVRLGR